MQIEILDSKQISTKEKEELYKLFEKFYANTSYHRFIEDFAKKDWLIRMSNDDELAGFSTQELTTLDADGKEINVLFSGDTIVNPKFWQKTHMSGAFGHLFQRILRKSSLPLYWFLISKGFRTYRLLPVFFKTFFPVFDGKHSHLKPLLDFVAYEKFGDEYNPETGLIEYKSSKDRLCEDFAEIPENRKLNPHINFFLERNPDYKSGVELACLAKLSEDCLTSCGERVTQTTKVEWRL